MAVTRNDVARHAGVSPAVVSYVLNDGPRPVSAAARARVLEAVRHLDYRRDGLARSLRVGRTQTLGLVVPDSSNPFFAELARAVEDAAYDKGFAVLVCNSADDLERERRYITSLAERRIDGLVLVSASEQQDLSALTGLRIPVVALDRSPDASPVSTIRSDNRSGASTGTRHLLWHGHSIVGFVGGPGHGVSDARQEGWSHALLMRGLTPGPRTRVPFSYAGGADAARWWQSLHVPPTAVLVSSDVQAMGLMHALSNHGASLPGDLAVIAVDGTRAGQHASPSLTVVAQPIQRLGQMAVEHLIGGASPLMHAALDNELIIHRSCGCSPTTGSR